MIAEITLQGGGVRDEDVAPGAGIEATKVIHQQTASIIAIEASTTITAVTKPLRIVNAETEEIVSFEGVIFTQATGADRTVSVALQRSRAGGAFTTISSSPIAFTNSSAVRTPFTAVISDVDLEDGDVLQAVVTVAGSAGAQAAGLLLSLTVRSRPTS